MGISEDVLVVVARAVARALISRIAKAQAFGEGNERTVADGRPLPRSCGLDGSIVDTDEIGRLAYLALIQARRVHADAMRGPRIRTGAFSAGATTTKPSRPPPAAFEQLRLPGRWPPTRRNGQLRALHRELELDGKRLAVAEQARADYLEANPQVIDRVRNSPQGRPGPRTGQPFRT